MKNIVSIPKSQKGMKSAMSAEKESRNEDFTQDIIFNSNLNMYRSCLLLVGRIPKHQNGRNT